LAAGIGGHGEFN